MATREELTASKYAAIQRMAKLVGKSGKLSADDRAAFDQDEDAVRMYNQHLAGLGYGDVGGGTAVPSTTRQRYVPGTPEEKDFSEYLRTGRIGSNMRMVTTPDTRAELDSASLQTIPGQGGYMIPQGFWDRLAIALKAYGGTAADFWQIETETGNEMPWPATNPTGVLGQYVTEGNQVGFTDYTFGQGILYAWTITSGVILASLQLINDSAINVDEFVADRMGESIGRKVAAEAINGLGSAQKALTGIVTSLSALGTGNASGGVQQLGAATQVKTFAATSGTSELLANALSPATCLTMVQSVDPAYYPNAKWYLNSAQAWNMHGVIDSNGRPLLDFMRGFENGRVGEILGFPVVIDNNIANLTASTVGGVMFGDLEKGMVKRTVKQAGIMRLTERYADYLAVGYLGFVRTDTQPNDLRAVSIVKGNTT